jgi:hypothetical protein
VLDTAGDWPPCSTGASQSLHLPTLDRYPGFPAYRQRFMIITFGASTWRSGRSSLSASQIKSETAPAIAANSPCGHRRAATRPPSSSVKSPSGGPPTASTPATDDQPEQHSCRQLPRSGNTTSIAVSPRASTTTSVALTSKSGSLLQAGTKIDTACPDHPRPGRTHHPRRPFRSTAAKSRVWRHQIRAGQKTTPGRLPTAESGSIRSRAGLRPAPRRVSSLRCRPLRDATRRSTAEIGLGDRRDP